MTRVDKLPDVMGHNAPLVMLPGENGERISFRNWNKGVTQTQADEIAREHWRLADMVLNPAPNRFIEDFESE